jgi:integrase
LAAPIVTHRAAITDEEKLGELLRKIDVYDGRWPTLKAALRFLVLTMARPCEVRFMRKSEVNFIKRTWTVPAERMKMRRAHDVPLSNQALDILRSVWDEGDGLIFPSLHSKTKPLSENATCLRGLGLEAWEAG